MRKYFRFVVYFIAVTCFSIASADDRVDFFRAINIDNESTVRQLLMRGFDPNTRDEKGQPALVLAMRESSFKSAELLLVLPQLEVDATNAAKETAR